MERGEDGVPAGHGDRAYAALVRAIATCELPPGAVFNERIEAAKMGMSRTPFRQALHRLSLEGLIVSVPKRGVFVSFLSLDEIRSHMVVRLALEMELVRRMIVEEMPVPVAELRALIARMQTSAKNKDGRSFLELDEEFHMTIVRASGNRPALDAIQRSWIHVNRARYLETSDRPDIRPALAEHRTVLAALAAGDAERAVSAVRDHLEHSLDRLGDITERIPSAFLHDGGAEDWAPGALLGDRTLTPT